MAQKKRSSDATLITALAGGASVTAAAKRAGVSRRTVTRRLADPRFRASVERCRERMLERAMGRLSAKATAAADALGKLLADTDPRIRLNAARILLDKTVTLTDLVHIQTRLERIERFLPED